MTRSKLLRREIVESTELKEILQHCSYDTLGTFDLDNTLVHIAERDDESREQHDVGSDQWFFMLLTRAKDAGLGEHEALDLVLELNRQVQQVVQVKPVEEEMTPLILRRLQDVGLPLMGLTARGPDLSEITERQLNSAGVRFNKNLEELGIELDEKGGVDLPIVLGDQDPPRHVRYQNGLIYCDGADKGKCLNALFEHIKLQREIREAAHPEERHRETKYSVVMVDDKKHNLEKMLAASNAGGYAFTGIRYGATDRHVETYDLSDSLEKTAQFVHAHKMQLPEKAYDVFAQFKERLPITEPQQNKDEDLDEKQGPSITPQ